jgi:hypothetical protein
VSLTLLFSPNRFVTHIIVLWLVPSSLLEISLGHCNFVLIDIVLFYTRQTVRLNTACHSSPKSIVAFIEKDFVILSQQFPYSDALSLAWKCVLMLVLPYKISKGLNYRGLQAWMVSFLVLVKSKLVRPREK